MDITLGLLPQIQPIYVDPTTGKTGPMGGRRLPMASPWIPYEAVVMLEDKAAKVAVAQAYAKAQADARRADYDKAIAAAAGQGKADYDYEHQGPAKSGASAPSLLLPIGAAVAAFFFLKGH